MEVQQYIDNEREMLRILEQLKERMAARQAMEEQEPKLVEIRTFELKLRETADQSRKREKKVREEKEKKRKAQEELERLAAARKTRGAPPPKSSASNFDPDSSGQNIQ